MLDDGLGGTEEDALQELGLGGLLDLDEEDLAPVVGGLDIDAVGLGVALLSVALALEEFDDVDLFIQKGGEEAFEDSERGLVAKHVLGGPVETDHIVCGFHDEIFKNFSKDNIFFYTKQYFYKNCFI